MHHLKENYIQIHTAGEVQIRKVHFKTQAILLLMLSLQILPKMYYAIKCSTRDDVSTF